MYKMEFVTPKDRDDVGHILLDNGLVVEMGASGLDTDKKYWVAIYEESDILQVE